MNTAHRFQDDAAALDILRLCQSAVQYRLRAYDRVHFLSPEDLSHEVFVKFLARCRAWEEVPEVAASTLIYRMANDVVVDELRRCHYEAGADALAELEDPRRPGILTTDECQFWVTRLRGVITDGDRDVLDWFVANNRSVNDAIDRKEAAARLARSEGAVRAAVGRIVDAGHALPSCAFDGRFAWFRDRPSFKNAQALLAFGESDWERIVAHAGACVFYHRAGVRLSGSLTGHCEAVHFHARRVFELCEQNGIDPSPRGRDRWPTVVHLADQLSRWATFGLDPEQWHLVFGTDRGSGIDAEVLLRSPFETWVSHPGAPVPAVAFDRDDLF